jgi:hypothetical protein
MGQNRSHHHLIIFTRCPYRGKTQVTASTVRYLEVANRPVAYQGTSSLVLKDSTLQGIQYSFTVLVPYCIPLAVRPPYLTKEGKADFINTTPHHKPWLQGTRMHLFLSTLAPLLGRSF